MGLKGKNLVNKASTIVLSTIKGIRDKILLYKYRITHATNRKYG